MAIEGLNNFLNTTDVDTLSQMINDVTVNRLAKDFIIQPRPNKSSATRGPKSVVRLHINDVKLKAETNTIDTTAYGQVTQRVVTGTKDTVSIEAVVLNGSSAGTLGSSNVVMISASDYDDLIEGSNPQLQDTIDRLGDINATMENQRIKLVAELEQAQSENQRLLKDLEELRRRPPVVYEASF